MSFCLYNKNNITRRPAWGYEFYFLVAKTLFYSLSALVRKILFCHSKIKFISLLHRVISPLYISFKPGSSASELEAVTALQDCILDIKTWMTADKLKLNDYKTELIVIGTRAQLDKISISELSIDHVKVSAVCNVRNLGTWFDNHLSMKTAINKTCQSGLYHLHNIGRIKRFLSFEDRNRLFRQ